MIPGTKHYLHGYILLTQVFLCAPFLSSFKIVVQEKLPYLIQHLNSIQGPTYLKLCGRFIQYIANWIFYYVPLQGSTRIIAP